MSKHRQSDDLCMVYMYCIMILRRMAHLLVASIDMHQLLLIRHGLLCSLVYVFDTNFGIQALWPFRRP